MTGSVDVKATSNDMPESWKSPNITSFSRIRTAYVKDPDFMFIILSIKHKVYSCGGFNTPTLCVEIKGIESDCNTL